MNNKKINIILCAALLALSVPYTLAVDTKDVSGTGSNSPVFRLEVYNEGETYINPWSDELTSTYTLNSASLEAIEGATRNWIDVLGIGTLDSPIKIAVYTSDRYNAGAQAPYFVTDSTYYYKKLWYLLQGYGTSDNTEGIIEIGKGVLLDGWDTNPVYSSLYKGSTLPSLYTTMSHEIMHALGISSNAYTYKYNPDDPSPDTNHYFSEDDGLLNYYDSYLEVYKGSSYNAETSPSMDSSKQVIAEKGMQIKYTEAGSGSFDIYNYAPYFTGPKTLKALTGLTLSEILDRYPALESIKTVYENGTYTEEQILESGLLTPYLQDILYKSGGLKSYANYSYGKAAYGLPVNSYENNGPELSHTELRNSFMSHQNYRNWSEPMEAELALLNDLGYNVDTKKYFGKSVYLDNQEVNFSEGYNHNTNKGVGLHIYGSNNAVNQTSNVTSTGKGVIGARVEGVNNEYILNSGSKIDVSGDESIGIAVTWGKNHKIEAAANTTVKAAGNNGIGVSFDFGSNILGSAIEEKGSYSRSQFQKSYYNSDNPAYGLIDFDTETEGALVNSFDIKGTIIGKQAAIYISDNAWVENINIKSGADIQGNIISDWNSLYSGDYALVGIKSGDYYYALKDFTDEVTDNNSYYTNLNFGLENDVYNGTFKNNIKGSDIRNTIKMNINTGSTLTLDGSSFDNGSEISVYQLNNAGTINISDKVTLKTLRETDSIKGAGTINIQQNAVLKLDDSVKDANSTINIKSGGTLSTVNDAITTHKITNLVTEDDAALSFEIDKYEGAIVNDKFTINSTAGSDGTAKFDSISVSLDSLDDLIENGVELFTDKTVDMGGSTFSVYNNDKQYVFKQDSENLKNLVYLSMVEAKDGLSHAAMDATAGNYTIEENEKSITTGGYVNGSNFSITGADLNFNQNKGLIVDGQYNKNGTTVKVNTYNAVSDNEYKAAYTVQNKGKLIVQTNGNSIEIKPATDITTQKAGNSLYISKNSSADLNALNGQKIIISGKIQGEKSGTQISQLKADGNDIVLHDVDSVKIAQNANKNTLKGISTNSNWQLNNGIMTISNDKYLSSDGTNSVELNGGTLNLQNNSASKINLAKMELNSNTNVLVDLDFSNKTVDKFAFNSADNVTKQDVVLNIGSINFINADKAKQDKYVIPFVEKSSNSENLIGNVNANISDIMTPIYKYNVSYVEDSNSGSLVFQTPHGKDSYKSYNPSVMSEPVAAQAGGYFNQLASYDTSFGYMDAMMNLTSMDRLSLFNRNKYASISPDDTFMYSPNLLAENYGGLWLKPYTTFEKVDLKGGAKINNIGYGTFAGGDTDIIDLKKGWRAVYSGYAGYNGAHITHDGISTYQNGGLIGLSGTFYKNNYFAGLTANVGAGVANTDSMYGKEDFTMLTSGAALKTGYNFEFKEGRYIIQPSYLMSYSFVNTFDYTNAAGLRISQTPLHAIQIVPGLKFIMNTKSGWQPYLNCQVTWNALDKSKVTANDVELPALTVKPYVQYGAGVSKRFGDRFSGYGQVMIRNGGRTGVALSAGAKWTLGSE